MTFGSKRLMRLAISRKFPFTYRKKSADVTSYTNMITEVSQKTQPSDCRGGLLADQMGLGKSLTMISLIALSTCKTSEPIIFTTKGTLRRLKSTLVVVPYSRKLRL
jgi:SWI/SNF-related matrix-associated actin-dependent regulator of chromatin subfamily A3